MGITSREKGPDLATDMQRDTGKKPLISQSIEFSDFPLDSIKIWLIDKVAVLPSEY